MTFKCRMVKEFVMQTSGLEVVSAASEAEMMRIVMSRLEKIL